MPTKPKLTIMRPNGAETKPMPRVPMQSAKAAMTSAKEKRWSPCTPLHWRPNSNPSSPVGEIRLAAAASTTITGEDGAASGGDFPVSMGVIGSVILYLLHVLLCALKRKALSVGCSGGSRVAGATINGHS
ncbi:hypothetical protein BHE74_00030031 [Ensete ventricosum]|nr:hypothetical protein BHE74_00030031 [Ensete ventricosum]